MVIHYLQKEVTGVPYKKKKLKHERQECAVLCTLLLVAP